MTNSNTRADRVATAAPNHAQGGSAQVAEDEDPVEKGVGAHGHAEHRQAQLGIFHGAVGPQVDLSDGVKDVGEAHNPAVLGGDGDDLVVIGEEADELHRKKEHNEGER